MSEFNKSYHLQTLGLEHAEWLSYDYIASDDPDDHPGMIEVS